VTASDELHAEVERALGERFGAERRVVVLERRPCPYRTSFVLEELDVELDDGTRVALMLKDVSRGALAPGARAAKPSFLYDPCREIEVYRSILDAALGTAAYYGSLVDTGRDRYWLLIEKVDGIVLWQVGELSVWELAARWLARLHGRFDGATDSGSLPESLLRYDADFYRLWPRRAMQFAVQGTGQREGKQALEWLSLRHDEVVERLTALPITFIHGEFYASNVLIGEEEKSTRICPIDWEMAAIGPGLIDLAALTTGNWTDEQKNALALSYRDATSETTGSALDTDAFLAALDCCRLQLAVQWLGWSPNWTPPPEHRQNWLEEALRLAEKLDL
jgi:hypothetical protein